MFDTRLFGYNLLVLLVFILHQQLDIAKAEDISSEFETDFEDDISFQQRTTTPSTTPSPTKYYKDYYQDEVASKSDSNDELTLSNSGSFSNNPVLYGYSKTQSDEDNQRRMNKVSPPSYGNVSNSPKEWMSNTKKLVHSNFEKHKSHHRNYRRYGHKSHKKSYSKYKKYDHLRGKHKISTHNTFNQKPYYQGQVTYYGDTDSADGTFHSAPKMRSHRYQHNNRGSSRSGGSTDRHHINGPNDYIRNSKWPHLSRVQYQLFEDEKQEIEEDLPPYIKKYNRRNKQLLDLLEGTMPPPTPPQQHHYEHQIASGTRKREKTQHRYHNRKNPKWIIEDLFEEQRANPNNPNKEDDQYMDDSAVSSVPVKPVEVTGESNEMKLIENNELPGDNMDVSQDMEDHQLKTVSADIGGMDNGGGGGGTSSIVGGSSSSSSISSSISSSSSNDKGEQEKNYRQSSVTSSVATPHDELKVSPKANKFIYHRVASPRVVGTGGGAGIGGSKKQRLPFVAITDRRLETSKMRQKDFEQNHLPLP